jgi:hypothetical protein
MYMLERLFSEEVTKNPHVLQAELESKITFCQGVGGSACKRQYNAFWNLLLIAIKMLYSWDTLLLLLMYLKLLEIFAALVVLYCTGVLAYRSGGPGSIPGTARKKSSGSGTGSTQPREYN